MGTPKDSIQDTSISKPWLWVVVGSAAVLVSLYSLSPWAEPWRSSSLLPAFLSLVTGTSVISWIILQYWPRTKHLEAHALTDSKDPLLNAAGQSETARRKVPPEVKAELQMDRRKKMEEARRRIQCWVTVLMQGWEVPVNGKVQELQLCNKNTVLAIGDRQIHLAGVAFRHNSTDLTLLVDGEELTIDVGDTQQAVELLLCFKTVRAGADSGAGLGSWGDRPDDVFTRKQDAATLRPAE